AMMAVVDVNADKHGVRAAADAFVAFSLSPAAQGLLTKYGFRPVDPALAPETERAFPLAVDVFRIDALGGWEKAKKDLYGPGGVFPRAWDAVTSEP
ncbi:MAG TPA: sulfate ABC transporter substrate-binding protein, partial [Polyangiaceae bacterium]